MKTFMEKTADVQRDWYVVDAADQVLGRLSTQIATLLRGKHKPTFTPHIDGGDFVVVVNAEKVRVTGRKFEQKMYYRHSGYPGGFKQIPYRRMMEKHPDRIIRFAVKGMIPKTRLGRQLMRKLKIYPGPTHPHAAQLPRIYTPRVNG